MDSHVRMGLARELQDVAAGMRVVGEFPAFARLPIVLSEADPEGCAACSARAYPQNAYRNGALYRRVHRRRYEQHVQLADRDHANIEGMLTWAFEFEDQPYFDGFRTLATNGIDKPVLNVFRMAGAGAAATASRSNASGAVALDAIDGERRARPAATSTRWPSAPPAKSRCWSGIITTTTSRPRPPRSA